MSNTLSASEREVLQTELSRAIKRRDDQRKVVENNRYITSSPVALPSLVRIAVRRLPKLLQLLEESEAVVRELQVALNDPAPVQSDIESAAPAAPLRGGRRPVST